MSYPPTRESSLRARFERVPIYPALTAGAIILSLFADSSSSSYALWRPLAIALIVTLLLQATLTAVLRQRHLAAFVAVLLVLILLGLGQASIAILIVVNAYLLGVRLRSGALPKLPWPTVTRIGNLVSVIVVILASASLVAARPYWASGPGPRGVAPPGAPDVYFILLDGHPRADTMRSEFQLDPDPFLSSMNDLGFVESPKSRSNYNLTMLTLASMFNGQQIDDLVPDGVRGLSALNRAINTSRMPKVFRAAGYDFVTIPSESNHAGLEAADQYLDSGQVSGFELGVLQQGYLPDVFPSIQREWLVAQHRERVLATFERLGRIAGEPASNPRFVFAHVMSPHPPIAFAADGSPVDMLPCFPQECQVWDGGERYPDGRLAAHAGQISFIDTKVLETVRAIQARSARPPVIVVFSDHGHRLDMYDQTENLRSFLLTVTPGRTDVFPPDATPVNYLARIANAYLGTSLAMASEESFWIDIPHIAENGYFSYRPAQTSDSP